MSCDGEPLTAALLLERLSSDETARARRVEAVLPALREMARAVDQRGEFHPPHIETLRQAGLVGLIVPTAHGGLGGGLRDLAATTFALGSACPSTALAYYFHCSTASRGLLALDALDAGLFPDGREADCVRRFAHLVLDKMGHQARWLANFASESVKSATSAVTIATEAVPVDGGFRLTGEKSFGCSTGIADEYLVTARLAGHGDADGIGLFFVRRHAVGVSERARWDALGMRGTATHGIILDGAFVRDEDALAVPGAFAKMMRMSRGSFVGSQLAATAVYVGAAQAVYDHTIAHLRRTTFSDTRRPIGESPMHQELIGRMTLDLETAYLWLRRQLELESSDPPLREKPYVVRNWRLAKGEIAEAAFRVGTSALKASGTGQTGNGGPIARGLRDLAMGLVQAFPAERGRLEVAKLVLGDGEQAMFSVGGRT
jgi:alkylation response protein AidB-like acyl-CoA dehydrogenase